MKPTPQPQIHLLPLAHLHPHPQNANAMSPSFLKKLQAHLAASPHYEPLIVRPHPSIPSQYQLINGHHRALCLRALHHTHANCLIWPLDDAQTLLLLATCNRLAGDDIPSKRLALLQSLHAALPVPASQLARLLPEDDTTLSRLLDQSPPPLPRDPLPTQNLPVAFTLFLTPIQKKRLLTALERTHPNPSTALLTWLDQFETLPAKSPAPKTHPQIKTNTHPNTSIDN